MLLGVASLLAGLWGGLRRMGWDFPELRPSLLMAHGPLMVCGFLGTVICLERAVALGRRWGFISPLAAGVGGVLAIAAVGGAAPYSTVAAWATLLASIVLLVMFVDFVRKQTAVSMVVMAAAAALWTVGIVLWVFGRPMNMVTYWWMGFIVLTILGERYAFSRLMAPSKASKWFFGLSNVFVFAGPLIALGVVPIGALTLGAGLAATALWIFRFDISLKTIRTTGLPRYVAVCVQAGAAWLVVGGVMLVLARDIPAGPRYDVIVHAVFVGFAFSMIFGHAPLVFPSVLKLPLEYRSFFYGPLVLLHASLAVRVVSDLTQWTVGRQWGGVLNAVAILLFFASNIASAVLSRGSQKKHPAQS
jgi:hypothetical protein